MSYQYTLLVKKTGASEWTIFNQKSLALYVLNRCIDKNEAETRAKAWASSWSSVDVRIVDDAEMVSR